MAGRDRFGGGDILADPPSRSSRIATACATRSNAPASPSPSRTTFAEGFERGTNQELLTFLYIARGSAGEVRSMLCLLQRIPGICDLESEISGLKTKAESISRQLGAWTRALQDSGLKGQRYVTEKTRATEKVARERDEFLKELQSYRDQKT